jgi:hypothetical protein
MLIRCFLLVCFGLILNQMVNAQELPFNPRKWDTEWTYSKFEDFFIGDTLNTSKWDLVQNTGRGNCIFLDSLNATYYVDNDYLNLCMIKKSGYSYLDNDNVRQYPEYIAAEVNTKVP